MRIPSWSWLPRVLVESALIVFSVLHEWSAEAAQRSRAMLEAAYEGLMREGFEAMIRRYPTTS